NPFIPRSCKRWTNALHCPSPPTAGTGVTPSSLVSGDASEGLPASVGVLSVTELGVPVAPTGAAPVSLAAGGGPMRRSRELSSRGVDAVARAAVLTAEVGAAITGSGPAGSLLGVVVPA